MHTVLSIQSFVSHGHAGNSSAMFPLQRCGFDVMGVHTVLFSNHTGHDTWRGPLIPATDVAEIISGIDERGALASVDAVLSGYLGSVAVGRAVLDAVDLTKRRNPEALFLADPVMGDRGTGFYCAADIPVFFREHVVPKTDIMTPNLFELEQLVGESLHRLDEVLAAAERLRCLGPDIVLVTSVLTDDLHDDGLLRMLAVGPGGAWLVETPRLDRDFVGTGDLTAALFLAHWLETADLERSLAATASAVYSVLEQTHILGGAARLGVGAQAPGGQPRNQVPPPRLPRTG
ncbi:MAG: pyridoxal kinase PdxY, partial [Propionibacteriaceae bacterium]|nr:pyridoxal kinase PdxY [Propionibacteriaceae bacterium]